MVQTSAVYLIGRASRPVEPPPSPPSPLSPRSTAGSDCSVVDDLELDSDRFPEKEFDPPVGSEATRVHGAIHVLKTEATALQSVTQLYEIDPVARSGFDRAVAAITRHGGEKGKVVVIGVGKSGHIGRKLVATFNSLGVQATFLHPTEALHGDLGTISKHDTILFITFSGKTQELMSILPHIDHNLPQIILTSHIRPETCEMIERRKGMILLPAPIHEPEAKSFGLCAPTTSTTVALAVGDALAVVAGRELHSCVEAVFAKNHPGGAIGVANARRESHRSTITGRVEPKTIMDVCTPISEISTLDGCVNHSCAEVLRAGYSSKDGWVRVGNRLASPMRIRRLQSEDLMHLAGAVPDLLVPRQDMVALSSKTDMRRAQNMVRGLLESDGEEVVGEARFNKESVIAAVEGEEIVGVLELWLLLNMCEASQ